MVLDLLVRSRPFKVVKNTVLLVFILARVAVYGVWNGLGLNQLWAMSEWYYQALAVVIVLGLVIGVVILSLEGIENIRRNHFR